MSYLQFTKDDIMSARRDRRDGAARADRAPDGGAAAGAPHRDAGGGGGGTGGQRRHRGRHRRASGCPASPSPAAGAGGITNNSGTNITISGADEAVAISNRTSAMIDIAQVQGQVHAQSVQKVGEIAEKNPHEAVSIIRSWLHEDAA